MRLGALGLFSLVLGCSRASQPAGADPTLARTQPAPLKAPSAKAHVPEQPEASIDWEPLVLDLFRLDRRDRALRELLKRNHAAGLAEHEPDHPATIKETVLCPQPNGLPLVAVFLKTSWEKPGSSTRQGHFMIFRSDGRHVVFQDWNNVLNGYFLDVNGDGIVEHVDAQENQLAGAVVQVLSVTPVVEPFEEEFVVIWSPGATKWLLHQPDSGVRPSIRLFKTSDVSEKVVAEYSWSESEGQWKGPEGSRRAGFLVVKGDLEQAALSLVDPTCERLAEYVAENLAEVRKVFDEAPEEARPGGVRYPAEGDDFSMALGFHHDDRFEAIFFVDVVNGELSVENGGQPLTVPPTELERVRRACEKKRRKVP